MADLTPLSQLREEPGATGRAAKTLDLACSEYSWPRDRQVSVYWRIRGRLARSPAARRQWALRVALVAGWCGFLATAALLWRVLTVDDRGASALAAAETRAPASSSARALDSSAPPPSAWTRFDLGELGLIETSPSTAPIELRELASERQIHLRSGILRAHLRRQDPWRPVVIVTPKLRIVVVGTRFDVRADAVRTTVDLLEGAVSLETAGSSLLLTPGESISSDDPRLAPPPAPAMTPPASRATQPRARRDARMPASSTTALSIAQCESLASAAAQQRRFMRLSRADDLAAQTALYSWALRERDRPGGRAKALELLDEIQRRFAEGLLAPEAALREIEIRSGQDGPDAIAARAASFERRFPSHPRVDDVALVRASALCASVERRLEAQPLLDRLALAASAPEVRKLARALRARCSPVSDGDPPADAAHERGPPGDGGARRDGPAD